QACVRLRERAGRGEDLLLAVRAGALAPAASGDLEQLVRLAEGAVRRKPHAEALHALGLVRYRAGQYAEAIKQLEASAKVEPAWEANALNWTALALCHRRLGHADEARQWLDKARPQAEHRKPGQPADWLLAPPQG